jgi:Carboxylesterase family
LYARYTNRTKNYDKSLLILRFEFSVLFGFSKCYFPCSVYCNRAVLHFTVLCASHLRRHIERSAAAFGYVPLMLGVVGNEGYAYVDRQLRTTHVGDDDDDEDEDGSDEDAIDQVRWRRGLRSYVRENCRYHQQKILDVLSHNYNDWENEYRPQLQQHVEYDHTQRGAPPQQQWPAGTTNVPAGRRPSSRRSRPRPTARRRRVDDLAELIGDGQYAAPTVRLARLHSTCGRTGRPGHTSSVVGGPTTYMYAFDGELPVDEIEDSSGEGRSTATVAAGGGYKRDLAYVFGAPLADGIDPFATTNYVYTEADRKLSRTVLTYWTNFIRTGFVFE